MGHEALVPLQTYGEQVATVPALTGAHVPPLHVSQAPPHAVAQQVPPTQFPDAHSAQGLDLQSDDSSHAPPLATCASH